MFRHLKSCKNYKREGTCRFKEYCAYKHEKDKDQRINVKEIITNHEQEISKIKNEMKELKLITSQMGKSNNDTEARTTKPKSNPIKPNQIKSNQINIQEILKIVVETLDKSKDSVQ